MKPDASARNLPFECPLCVHSVLRFRAQEKQSRCLLCVVRAEWTKPIPCNVYTEFHSHAAFTFVLLQPQRHSTEVWLFCHYRLSSASAFELCRGRPRT